jgi:hypothetical protein
MWEPRSLTTLWAFTARYRDSFTFVYIYKEVMKRSIESPKISGYHGNQLQPLTRCMSVSYVLGHERVFTLLSHSVVFIPYEQYFNVDT